MTNSTDVFFASRATLRPAHAVAAPLQLADGRYLMQLRDGNPNIFYPEHWGCFGGAVDAGEAPVAETLPGLAQALEVLHVGRVAGLGPVDRDADDVLVVRFVVNGHA